jgi:hypothetical protein
MLKVIMLGTAVSWNGSGMNIKIFLAHIDTCGAAPE